MSAAIRILISGFQAFGGHETNPTSLLITALPRLLGDISAPRVSARGVTLPVTFAGAHTALNLAIADFKPHAVLALGQARGRASVEIERVAINCMDADLADNEGYQPRDLPILDGGMAAHFSSLPMRTLVADLQSAGIPAKISNSAGTFVCNHVFYRLMEDHGTSLRHAGFIHFPLLPEQTAADRVAPATGPDPQPSPSMPLVQMELALSVLVQSLARACLG